MAVLSFSHLLYWVAISLIFAGLGSSETFDLGKLDQYTGSDTGSHDLTGESLWLSGQDGKGFDVTLSGDLQKKIQGTLAGDSCKDKKNGNACYQAIRNALRSADVSVDSKLEKRGFLALLSKTFKKLGGAFTAIAGILYTQWQFEHAPQPHFNIGNHHIPQATASAAGGLDDGKPVTISADGSSVGVITPTPDPTAAPTGPPAAATSHVTAATSQYKPGDIIIKLGENEAHRIRDIIGMSGCKDTSGKKRSLAGGLAAAGCAVPAVLQQAGPAGAFDELRGFQANGPPIQFNGREMIRAANDALQVARELAPLVEIPPELIDHLAMMVFALGVQEFVDHVEIAAVNWIHGSTLSEGATATASASSKPSASCSSKSCVASCEEFGVIEACETTCKSVTACAAGDANKPKETVVTATTKLWHWDFINEPHGTPTKSAAYQTPSLPYSIKCDVKDTSGFPVNLFNGPQDKVYTDYCKKWSKDSKLKWTVDAVGKQQTKSKRSPPSDPDKFKDYTVDLSYTPGDNKKECTVKTCEESLSILGGCKNNGGVPQNMYSNGEIDVGCGKFSYKINKDDKPKPWFPTPDKPWVVWLYTYDEWAKFWTWEVAAGDKGEALDPCSKQVRDFGRAETKAILPQDWDKDWDKLPFPPANTRVATEGPWKDCVYKKFPWKGDDIGTVTCGDKAYKCERKKPDPLSTTCKPGDGGGWMTRPETLTRGIECYMD